MSIIASSVTTPAGGSTTTRRPTPTGLAKVIADEIGRTVDYRPVEAGGAARAAASIAELV